jgi:hypothetical protein
MYTSSAPQVPNLTDRASNFQTPTSGPTSPVSGPEITLVRAPPSPPTEPPTPTAKAPTPMKLAVRSLVQKASRGHISLSRPAPQPQHADEELESSFSD